MQPPPPSDLTSFDDHFFPWFSEFSTLPALTVSFLTVTGLSASEEFDQFSFSFLLAIIDTHSASPRKSVDRFLLCIAVVPRVIY